MKRVLVVVGVLCFVFIVYAQYGLFRERDTDILTESFEPWFREVVESSYIVMHDKRAVRFTSYHENEVSIEYRQIERGLKAEGYGIPDIIYIIHNHYGNPHFSSDDKDTYQHLLRDGFKGRYLLYSKGSVWIKELIKDRKEP